MSHDEIKCRQLILEFLIEYEDGSMPEPDRALLKAGATVPAHTTAKDRFDQIASPEFIADGEERLADLGVLNGGLNGVTEKAGEL